MKVNGNKVTASKGTKIAYKVKKSGFRNLVGSFTTGSENTTVTAPSLNTFDSTYVDENSVTLFEFDNGFTTETTEYIDSSLSTATISTDNKKFGTGSACVSSGKAIILQSEWGDLDLFGSDFTVDFWIHGNGFSSMYQKPFALFATKEDFDNNRPLIELSLNTTYAVTYHRLVFTGLFTNETLLTDELSNMHSNEWNHIAIVFDKASNTFMAFANGIKVLTHVLSSSQLTKLTGAKLLAMSDIDYTYFVDELRISKSVRYSENFRVPTKSYLDDPRGGISDDGEGSEGSEETTTDIDEQTLEVYHFDGNNLGAIHGGKFSEESIWADWGNEYIFIDDGKFGKAYVATRGGVSHITNLPVFTDKDFTIDYWVKPGNGAYTPLLPAVNLGNVGGFNVITTNWLDDGKDIFINNDATSSYVSFATPENYKGINFENKWVHVAYVRHGSNFYIYVDGVRIIKAEGIVETIGGETVDYYRCKIEMPWTTDSYYQTAFDELRISTTARWTGDYYTVPTVPYGGSSENPEQPAQGGTTILLSNFESDDLSFGNVTVAESVKPFQILSDSPKFGSSYLSCDNYNSSASSYANEIVYNIPQNQLGRDWTLGFWCKVGSANAHTGNYVLSLTDNDGGVVSFRLRTQNNNAQMFLDYCLATGGTATFNSNDWNHIAITYTNEAISMFVNGIKAFTYTISSLFRNTRTYSAKFYTDNYQIASFDAIEWKTGIKYVDNFDVPTTAPESDGVFTATGESSDSVTTHTISFYSEYDTTIPDSIVTTNSYITPDKLSTIEYTGTDEENNYTFNGWLCNDQLVDDILLLAGSSIELQASWTVTPKGNYVYGSESDYFWLTMDNFDAASQVVYSVITGTWYMDYSNFTYSDKNGAIALSKNGGFATVYYENGISKLELFGIRSGSWNLLFEGSNDDSNYTEISTYTNTSGAHDIVITPTTSYKCIKITNFATGSTYIQGFKLASNNAEIPDTPDTPDTPEQDDNQQETWKSLSSNELADKQEEMSVNSEQLIDNMQGRHTIEGCQYELDISGSPIIYGSIYSNDDQLEIESELLGKHEFKTKTYDITDGSFDGTYLSTACDSQIFVPVFLKDTNINVVYQNVCWASYEAYGSKFEGYISDEIHTINYVATKEDETRGYCAIPLLKDMFPTEYNPKSQHIIIRGVMCSFEGPYVDDADDESSAAYTFTIKETSGKYLYYADEDGNTQSVFTGYVKSLPTGATPDTVVTIYCDQECTKVAFTTSTLTKHAALGWNESTKTYSVKNYENDSYPDQIGGNYTGSFSQQVTEL